MNHSKDLNNVCNNSNDCSYGLFCASSDNVIFTCQRNIPLNLCNSITCEESSKSALSESCGGNTVNILSKDCIENYKCTSNNTTSTSAGICSIIK